MRRRRVGVAAGRPAERCRSGAACRPATRASASPPAIPVATSSEPSKSVAERAAVVRRPRGIPISTGFGGSPDAMRSTRLSSACSRRRRPAGPRRSRGRAPARSARRLRSGRWARWSPAPDPIPRCTRSTRPVVRSATSAVPRVRQHRDRDHRVQAGGHHLRDPGRRSRTVRGRRPVGVLRGALLLAGRTGVGDERRAAQLARPLDLLPPVARAGVGEGGAAVSARASATPATARRTRPIIDPTLGRGG